MERRITFGFIAALIIGISFISGCTDNTGPIETESQCDESKIAFDLDKVNENSLMIYVYCVPEDYIAEISKKVDPTARCNKAGEMCDITIEYECQGHPRDAKRFGKDFKRIICDLSNLDYIEQIVGVP